MGVRELADGHPDARPTLMKLCEDGALTIRQATEFTGLPRTAVYKLLGDGTLPSVRVGRRRLIPKRALIELLAQGLE